MEAEDDSFLASNYLEILLREYVIGDVVLGENNKEIYIIDGYSNEDLIINFLKITNNEVILRELNNENKIIYFKLIR